MGISITNNNSKMPQALRLASAIASFLFEQEYGECRLMKTSEIEALRKAQRAIARASARTAKTK